MNKPKILFVMHMPPPIHGAAIVGQNIYKSQKINNSFECTFINLSASNKVSHIGKIRLRKLFFLIENFWKVVAISLKEKPDLIYLTPSSTWDLGFFRDFLTVMSLKLLNKNIIVHLHNKGVSRAKGRLSNKMFKLFFNNIKVILLAEELYSDVKSYVDLKNVFICANGMPQKLVNESIEAQKKNVFSILFLSNMMIEKGPLVLLKACRILKDRGNMFECNFIGKWSDIPEKYFNSIVKKDGLENIVIAHGSKYGKEKIPFFQQADLFVFPTFYQGETFGLVLLEAMEFGLPCITTNEGGIPSIIKQGVNGLFSKSQDADDLANKIEILIQNPKLGKELGNNGRNMYKEKFTIDVFENRLNDILNACVK